MGADSASPSNTDPQLFSQVLPWETPTERLRAWKLPQQIRFEKIFLLNYTQRL